MLGFLQEEEQPFVRYVHYFNEEIDKGEDVVLYKKDFNRLKINRK